MTARIDPAKDERVAWLVGQLEAAPGGARPANEIKELARARGIADRTLDRVRQRAGVRTRRDGYGPGKKWLYFLSYDPAVRRDGGENAADGSPSGEDTGSSDENDVDPDAGWSLAPAGEALRDCDLCGWPSRTLWWGVPRCRPSCPTGDENRRPPEDPLARVARRQQKPPDRLEQAWEAMHLRGERTMRMAARGRAWPACTSCSIPAQWVDELGRCHECAQRGEGLPE